MNPTEAETFMLLAAHVLALVVALLIFGILYLRQRRAAPAQPAAAPQPAVLFSRPGAQRPASWLAVRGATPEAVRRALELNRCSPCSWTEGMAGDHEFFISPRLNGWVIVKGLGVPNPGENVDVCFHFLTGLSRKLGHVQFFHAETGGYHHAWARLDDGYVTRAYAWAGGTVWRQGDRTVAETELRMKCFDYGEETFAEKTVMANCDKVPLLAARWSLDPARIRMLKTMNGIAGVP